MASQLISNIDLSKIFLGNDKTRKATYTNGTGSPVTLVPGRIMGHVISNGKVLPQNKDSTDGSQQPRFVLMSAHDAVADGASVQVTLCVSGEVDASKLICASGETLDSAVGTTGLIGDLLMANSHILLVDGVQNTFLDNQ
ncbi:MAG: hypothetical protein QM743_08670 [Chitinophagaceae bacterium]